MALYVIDRAGRQLDDAGVVKVASEVVFFDDLPPHGVGGEADDDVRVGVQRLARTLASSRSERDELVDLRARSVPN